MHGSPAGVHCALLVLSGSQWKHVGREMEVPQEGVTGGPNVGEDQKSQ